MSIRHTAATTALLSLVYVSNVHAFTAFTHPMMTDRYFFSVGMYYPDANTQASVNSGAVGIGSFIDFENDFGLDQRNLISQFMFRMRLSERWRLEVEHFNLERDHEKSVSRNIDIGRVSIPINARVNSSFDFEDTRVGVGYSFFRTHDKEVGIGLGVHVVKLETQVDASGFGSEHASTSAPLPTLTVYADIALTNRWLLGMRLDRLSADVGDTDGSVSSTALEFVYQPWRNVNIGIGYRDVGMQITTDNDDWRGSAQIQQRGPFLFLGTTF